MFGAFCALPPSKKQSHKLYEFWTNHLSRAPNDRGRFNQKQRMNGRSHLFTVLLPVQNEIKDLYWVCMCVRVRVSVYVRQLNEWSAKSYVMPLFSSVLDVKCRVNEVIWSLVSFRLFDIHATCEHFISIFFRSLHFNAFDTISLNIFSSILLATMTTWAMKLYCMKNRISTLQKVNWQFSVREI